MLLWLLVLTLIDDLDLATLEVEKALVDHVLLVDVLSKFERLLLLCHLPELSELLDEVDTLRLITPMSFYLVGLDVVEHLALRCDLQALGCTRSPSIRRLLRESHRQLAFPFL